MTKGPKTSSIPKVSILVATYNRADFLPGSIESALNQTFQDFEIIIADDGSPDHTQEVVEKLIQKDPRIRYVRGPHVGWPSITANLGLNETRGEYIAILDDDDRWSDPEKLEKQVAFLDANSDYVGCGGGAIIIDEHDQECSRYLKPSSDEDIRDIALIANPIVNSTTLFRNQVAKDMGYNDTKINHYADWDFWLKMGERGKLYNFQEYFLFYRIWGGSVSFISHIPRRAIWSPKIVWRHRKHYPRFYKAFAIALVYYAYSFLPNVLKKNISPKLSQMKKLLFRNASPSPSGMRPTHLNEG